MHLLDWLILAGYLVGIVGMSIVPGRRQQTADDYYMAGRKIGAWAVALSIAADG